MAMAARGSEARLSRTEVRSYGANASASADASANVCVNAIDNANAFGNANANFGSPS